MASRKLYISMWLATIVVAFLVRSGVGCYWQSQLHAPHAFGAFEGDSHAYWVLGLQILKGKPYRYGDDTARVFRTPGYPLMLAGMFAVLGKDVPVLMARHLNAVWGTVTVILAGCLAGLLFGGQVALIAGILVAIYPGSIVMGSLVLTEAPFCPWMLLQLICWLQAVRSDSSRSLLAWSLLGGASAGIAVLIRPSWFLFTAFSIVVALVAVSQKKRQAVIGGLILTSMVLVLMPWWVRNYQVTGQFVPTTLQVGASLYDGLNPEATGASDMRFVLPMVRVQQAADAASSGALPGTFESRLDRRFRQAAIGWACQHPGRVLQLMGTKLIRMWNVWPNADPGKKLSMRLVMMFSYLPMMGLAGLGLWQQRRAGWGTWLCALPAIYFTFLHMVFVSSLRYRQPAMVPLLILAAVVLGSWFLDKEVHDEQACSATT